MTIPYDRIYSGLNLLINEGWVGEMGTNDPNNPSFIGMFNGATAVIQMNGNPDGTPHFGRIDAYGWDAINVDLGGGYGHGGQLTVNIGPYSIFADTVNVHSGDSYQVNQGFTSELWYTNIHANGGFVGLNADLHGTNSIIMSEGDHQLSPYVGINGQVSSDTTIGISSGTLEVWQPMAFLGTVDWNPQGTYGLSSEIELRGLAASSMVASQDYAIHGENLIFFDQAGAALASVRMADQSHTGIYASQTAAGVVISAYDQNNMGGHSAIPPLHGSF